MKQVSYRNHSSDEDDDDDGEDISEAQLQLYFICQCGYREKAVQLLKQGVNPNFFLHGEAPIHVAAKANHAGILAALLIAPCDVDGSNGEANHRRHIADAAVRDSKYSWTALHWAVSMGNLEALSILSYLSPKETMRVKDSKGRTALQLAQEMALTRRENCSTIMYPYLPLNSADVALSILSEFSSDRQSRDGRLSRPWQRKENITLYQSVKLFVGDLLGKNGVLANIFPRCIFLTSYGVSCIYSVYFNAKPVSCNYYSHPLCDSSINGMLCWVNIFSHITILIILICIYQSSPGELREELTPFTPPSSETSLSLAEDHDDYDSDDQFLDGSYCQSVIHIANRSTPLGYWELKSVCHICRVFRPHSMRAGHCKQIQRCIPHYDHYCVFLGKAVGKNNIVYFMAFLVSMGLFSMPLTLYIYAEHLQLYKVVKKGANFVLHADFRAYFIVEFSIWVFFMWCYVIILLIFHSFLMVRGQSTREFLSKHYDEHMNLTCHPIDTDTEMIEFHSNNKERNSERKQTVWRILCQVIRGTVASVMLLLCFLCVLVLVPQPYLDNLCENIGTKGNDGPIGTLDTTLLTISYRLIDCRKYMKLMIVSILRNAGMNSGQLGTIIDAISDTAASTDDVRMTL